LVLIFVAGAAYAITPAQNDDAYKDIDQLKLQIRKMKREMSGLIKEVTAGYSSDSKALIEGWGQDINIDVTETDKDVLVKADLPGMDKDRIEAVLEQNKLLKIAGSRDVVKSQSSQGVVVQERARGAFSRTIELPVECRSDGIKASYNNGVLDISIPKKEMTKEDTVKIKVQ
ncbi:MAG: Hsp20/alpha crystallin family protein, partial [Candidatus Omnitrophica bacterium]|nr:Hsp20/alpha crystallin family protein [Candidatus Omnitrophota bacterium]